MIHCVAVHARHDRREPATFWLSRLRKEPGMRYRDSIFANLLKPISRRQFRSIVERHDGNAYDKSFDSWDHLVALIFAQLGGADSLRGLETGWNAQAHHHYHLGAGRLARSTLSDANARRPPEIFAATFTLLSAQADRQLRREGAEVLRLIDATPIPLAKLCDWADWNGRTRGLKLHVVYDPRSDHPRCVEITPATINDVEIGRVQPIEAGAIYLFDKAYCDYAWWMRLHQAGARFVTRPKTNAPYQVIRRRPLAERTGNGFTVLDDADVELASQSRRKLAIPIRRVRVRRQDGTRLTFITNDLDRPATEIAAFYKDRWQIELLFRWIKQHLKLRKFLGRSENAIRLQILAAMIAYLLLRIAARANRLTLPAIRFAELIADCLFVRKPIARIDKPPECNPSKPQPFDIPNQLKFRYA
jgi:putative transposase